MTDLEKAKERVKTAQDVFELVQHASTHDRKLSKDGKSNGHYTTALSELKKVIDHEQSMVDRLVVKSEK